MDYSMANRKDRLNLLYACVIVITTKKHISDTPFEDKVVVQALEHLDEIYRMIMGSKKQKVQTQPQRRQQKTTTATTTTTTTSSSRTTLDDDYQKEKMQALFCYAYVKPSSNTDQLSTKNQARPPCQQQYKELDLQCGSWNPLTNDTVTVQKLDAAVAIATSTSTSVRTSHAHQPMSNRDRSRNAT
jgi:hypothetical protein